MVLRVFLASLLALPVSAASWTEYHSGPLVVISDAGDRAARERLTEMEQLRYVLGGFLGKKDLQTVWPVQLVLFSNQREYGTYALPQPFVEGGAATLSAWAGDKPLPHDWLRSFTRLLIEDNAGRMPEAVETALCDLFSTIQVNATKVSVGAPLAQGELPPARLRAWAKLQMLATSPDYSGRLHVYLNNLQQGGVESVALRNSFDIAPAEMEARVDAYVRAGMFAAAPVVGEALSPSRDFIEKQAPQSAIDELFAGLKTAGKEFPPDSPRGLLAKGTRPALDLAAKANPRWAEPHVKLAALESEPAAKIKELKAAATLDPRNSGYWQALALAQSGAEQYADADKSWLAAERSAPNDTERARIHQARLDMDEQRALFEIAERKRLAAERAAELERIKASAAAEVHAAETAANQRMGGLASGQAPVPWWNDADGQKLSGTLTRVDCAVPSATGSLRLTVQPASGGAVQPASGAAVRLLIRDPNKLTVKGANQAEFACGVQKPARKINLVHDGKPDAKLGVSGDISTVELP